MLNRRRERMKQNKKKQRQMYQNSPNTATRTSTADIFSAASGIYLANPVKQITVQRFNQMLIKHNVTKRTNFSLINCSEAQLWMQIVDKGRTPRKLNMETIHNKKVDDPCLNCRQWVYKEFGAVNNQTTKPERL